MDECNIKPYLDKKSLMSFRELLPKQTGRQIKLSNVSRLQEEQNLSLFPCICFNFLPMRNLKEWECNIKNGRTERGERERDQVKSKSNDDNSRIRLWKRQCNHERSCSFIPFPKNLLSQLHMIKVCKFHWIYYTWSLLQLHLNAISNGILQWAKAFQK